MRLRAIVVTAIVLACSIAAAVVAARPETTPAQPNRPTSTIPTTPPGKPTSGSQPTPSTTTPIVEDSSTAASSAAVATFAADFAAQFARPAPDEEDEWRDQVGTWLDADTAALLSQIPPQIIAYTRATGPAQVTGQGPWVAKIPTDATPLRVSVCTDATTPDGLVICGIDLGGRA